jgi:NAD(P)-dependent dehydrogenase (short-subunit alcohol dehydrogenase family)
MKICAVNVLGPSLLAAAALPYLAVAKKTIINVSSTFGHKPVAGLSHYASSKAALEHLTRQEFRDPSMTTKPVPIFPVSQP